MAAGTEPHIPAAAALALEPAQKGTRPWVQLFFIVLSIAVQMSIGQEDNVEINSIQYWLLILPALLLPLLGGRRILHALLDRRTSVLFLCWIVAAFWHALHNDFRAVSQLALLVWVTCWLASSRTALIADDLAKLYVGLVIAGALLNHFTSLNVWGLLPETTRADYGVWRVSFFPNIANTGILSLFLFMVLTRNVTSMKRHPIALTLCVYFLVFSFVRTAQIAAILYLATRFWLEITKYPGKYERHFWTAIVATVMVHAFIVCSPYVLEWAQQLPLVSRLFLRGEGGLNSQEIFVQAYRPWLWWQHLEIFASSRGLMGLGAFEFADVVNDSLISEHVDMGSESFPTRLLASYGLAAMLFLGFIIDSLKRLANEDDRWACACFPAILLLMTNWGSVFHPANAIFFLFFFILIHGSKGFQNASLRQPGAQPALP